ncbi:ACT domain-containing protein [Vibrio marisflavi]|uniref:Aspartate kinase n=1 Tax=Vibrio marisflavi CECT 7928 TaxID=634439 RepID=A0ABM9A1R3_9VIBR|nr:ACT domain-containing protein [Vibrio marisflavi]CAH0537755.1 hypothetical protein VMF7928_01308 [Vibrio marisflavi CECT 7928]
MSGITELSLLIKSMSPKLQAEEYVFCSVPKQAFSQYALLEPICTFQEKEGITLIVTVQQAMQANLSFDGKFKQITLQVHSSLDAVGLTAAVSTKLASVGISANVVAAYFHDHVYVPSDKADEAMEALLELSEAGK